MKHNLPLWGGLLMLAAIPPFLLLALTFSYVGAPDWIHLIYALYLAAAALLLLFGIRRLILKH